MRDRLRLLSSLFGEHFAAGRFKELNTSEAGVKHLPAIFSGHNWDYERAEAKKYLRLLLIYHYRVLIIELSDSRNFKLWLLSRIQTNTAQ